MIRREAEQLYTFADLVRLRNELLGADIVIPGGGHKAMRWSASRIAAIQSAWRVPSAGARPSPTNFFRHE